MAETITVLRSLLFVPADNARRVAKAFTLDADAVILDLEDAVAEVGKEAARAELGAALSLPRRSRAYVRVNGLETRWCLEDVRAAVLAKADGIILPKAEKASDPVIARWLIRSIAAEAGWGDAVMDLIPLIETGAGVAAVAEIARAPARISRLAFGAGDFTLDMDLHWSRDETELLPARAAIVLASRAAGLEAPLDTPWVALDDRDGFVRSASRGRQLGFQGKLCIHPDQLGPVNGHYSPTPEQVARAEADVSAFRSAEAQGVASIRVEGRFVDYPIAARAQSILDHVTAIRRKESALFEAKRGPVVRQE